MNLPMNPFRARVLPRLLPAIAAAVLSASCGSSDGPTSARAGVALSLVPGSPVTDTIMSQPSHGLVVQLLKDGAPQPGVDVRFNVQSQEYDRIGVSRVDGTYFTDFASAVTDAQGRATVRISF